MKYSLPALALALTLAGCATSKNVTLGQPAPAPIKTVVVSAEDGNSPAMDGYIREAVTAQGATVAGTAARGARTTPDADAVLSYVDVWAWDLVMYLKSIDVHLFDGKSGNLLASGRWQDSTLHGFRDAKEITRDLIADVMTKVKPGAQAAAVPEPAASAAL